MDDLKVIKKLYGEAMSHFCREMFSTILEQKGALLNILASHFEPSRFLYQDIIEQHKEIDFKSYIYELFDAGIREVDERVKTPEELLSDAGYTLYKCESEEDIQKFRKYYAPGEEICTFDTHRLNDCYVFFAIKKNVDEIKREDFKNPKRQDLYGTSVISIQFSRDNSHILSIKNRYNHTVPNPDATFGNNLDSIIEGLTDSFAVHYGMEQKYVNYFDMPGYVLAKNGKYYKYNCERNNVYYCPDNVIINHGVPRRYPKEKYIILDYFILDLVNKRVEIYDQYYYDSFQETIGEIKNIKVENTPDGKRIIIAPSEGEDIIIELDKQNRIISYMNSNVTLIKNHFLRYNRTLKKLHLPNVKIIESQFLEANKSLTELILEEVEYIGQFFLESNEVLFKLIMPKVKTIEDFFCYQNKQLKILSLPSAEKLGECFLYLNEKLKKLIIKEETEIVAYHFCDRAIGLEIIRIPKKEENVNKSR